MKQRKCKFCKINLKIGQAIDPETDPDIRKEFSYFAKGKLIACYKCPKCGYSED